MPRKTDEWIGATPDAKIPPRIRLRVFEAHAGICALTGRKIQPGDKWDIDHKQALILGGEHRETNLQPVLNEAHKVKTAEDVKQKARDMRVRKKHLGIQQTKVAMPFSKQSKFKRKLNGQIVPRD